MNDPVDGGDNSTVVAVQKIRAGELTSDILDAWVRVHGREEQMLVSGIRHFVSTTGARYQVGLEQILPDGLVRYHYLDPAHWVELIE